MKNVLKMPMKNFTLNENVNDVEPATNSEACVKQPKNETVNALLAYSKSLRIKKSDLLNQEVSMNLN